MILNLLLTYTLFIMSHIQLYSFLDLVDHRVAHLTSFDQNILILLISPSLATPCASTGLVCNLLSNYYPLPANFIIYVRYFDGSLSSF